jgi:hypothetical protein
MIEPEPIAFIEFAGGAMRPVFEDGDRQYVIDDDGDRVYGVWFIPRDPTDEPIIVGPDDNEIRF